MPRELLNELMKIGVRPNWLGMKKDGTVLEYCSLPWLAGHDAFVLVREPDRPETVQCIELGKVRPIQLSVEQKAA